ncbi:hypothetical protein D3C73_1289110 [compost metagenome]
MDAAEIKSGAYLYISRKIQRLQHNLLQAQMGICHTYQPCKSEPQLLAAPQQPNEFAAIGACAEIQPAAVIRYPAAGQIQLFTVNRKARMQPVHRIYHITQRTDHSLVMIADLQLLMKAIEVAARQGITAVALLGIAAHSHILVAYRKNRFRGPVPQWIEAFLDNRPGINLQIFVCYFCHE